MKPSEVIDKALTDYVSDAAHWIRGAYSSVTGDDKDDRYCMLGAIGKVTGEDPKYISQPVYRALWSVVCEITSDQHMSVCVYNDHLAQGYDDVRAVMEKARANLQERGE